MHIFNTGNILLTPYLFFVSRYMAGVVSLTFCLLNLALLINQRIQLFHATRLLACVCCFLGDRRGGTEYAVATTTTRPFLATGERTRQKRRRKTQQQCRNNNIIIIIIMLCMARSKTRQY